MNDNHWSWTPSLHTLIKPIQSLHKSTVVVGVSGYGGSGKSTLASALGKRLSASAISIDAFGTYAVFQRSDDWHGFDRKRLIRQILLPLAGGVHELSYDSCDDWDTWQTVPTPLVVERFLILEGVGLFHPDIVPYLDYRIWLDVPLATASARGIARERKLGREPKDVWKRLWEPNEMDFERKFRPKRLAHRLVRPLV